MTLQAAPAESPFSGLPNRKTPLHQAAELGNLDEVQRLLQQAGVNVNAQDSAGDTPLGLAVREGHAAVVNALLTSNAEPDLCSKSTTRTPLSYAVVGDKPEHSDIAKALLAVGAQANISSMYGDLPLHALAAKSAKLDPDLLTKLVAAAASAQTPEGVRMINLGNHRGDTPMHCAARWGQAEAVALLIRHGADVSAVNQKGQTPAQVATAYHGLLKAIPREQHAVILTMLAPSSVPPPVPRAAPLPVPMRATAPGTREAVFG